MEQSITAYLRQLKKAKGWTQQQISDESGVPLGTAAKYLSGVDDEAAGYETVRKLVLCLGGSLDELAGICRQDSDAAYQAIIAGLEARLAEKDARLNEKDERIAHRGQLAEDEQQRAAEVLAYERKRARTATIVSYIVLGIFAIITLIDWIVPTVGWIRR